MQTEAQKRHLEQPAALVALPEWAFIQVCHEGLLSEPHAGCTWKGTYYREGIIAAAYFTRNPGADALY